MKKIKRLILKFLRNEEHLQYMTDAQSLIKQAGIEILNIPAVLFAAFENLLGQEDEAMEVIRKSTLTKPISEANKKRKNIFIGFEMFVKSNLRNLDEIKALSASNMLAVFKHYKAVRNKGYNEGTAAINNFLQDLEYRCEGEIDVLMCHGWLTDLSAANEAFDVLMNKRHSERAERTYYNLVDVRKEIDQTYMQLVERIEATMLLEPAQEIEDFIHQLNQRVEYFKNTVKMRKGRARKETTV